jgi:hypothetical protein
MSRVAALLLVGTAGCHALPQQLFGHTLGDTPAPEPASIRRLQAGSCGGTMMEMGKVAANCCG